MWQLNDVLFIPENWKSSPILGDEQKHFGLHPQQPGQPTVVHFETTPFFFVPKSRLAPRSSRKSWDDFLNPVGRKGATKKTYPGCFWGILVGDEIRKPSYLVDW